MTTQNNKSGERHGAIVHGAGRTHLRTELMRESLVSRGLEQKLTERKLDEVSLMPWCKFINIGGSSILDRGAKALLPLLDELVELRKDYMFVLSVGGGARMRHTFEIAMDLKLPIGGLAQIAGAVEEQNSHMVHALLSQHGGISMCRDHFSELPKYLLTGMIPIVISMPPYHFWEPPPRHGNLPENGSDLGAYLTAEVLGVNQMVFIKDQDGQYTRDPKRDPKAELRHEWNARALMDLPQEDLIIERSVLETMQRARQVRQVQVVNGLTPGTLTKALKGEKVGSIIKQDGA
jgi:molybdenum storage protein